MYFDDINEVRLMGNMTGDPELKFTPSGTAVLNFSMATNRRYKQGETWTDEVTYHNVVVWGNLAQGLAARTKKGTRVMVDGRIQTRSWDGQDGKKNYRTEVVANNVLLIDRYNRDVTDNSGAAQGGASMAATNDADAPSIDPDDLPF
jgi:single-strand DNA-binding protein